MKNHFLLAALLLLVGLLFPGQAQDQSTTTTVIQTMTSPSGELVDEVAALKRRVAELEAQNHAILQLLQTINAKLETYASVEAKAVEAVYTPELQPQAAPPEPAKATAVPETVKWNEVAAGGSKLKLYGFLRLDLFADSQRPNNPQNPLFILSPDASGNQAGAGNFSMTSRFTRLGIDFTGSRIAKLGDAKLSGRYEMDFFGNFGTESRANARIRFAWLKLNWEHASIVLGQDWQILSPLLPIPNQHGDMFAAGNVGDRRPLIKTEWQQKAGAGTLFLQGGIGLTGSSDAEDLDNDGFRDGETSGRPHIEGRIAYAHSLWVKDKPMTIGVGGLYGWEKTIRPVAGLMEFHPKLAALDYVLPLTAKLDWRGEAWRGGHLTDFRGGINQAVNLTTGREIQARGGWTELKLSPNHFYALHAGFTVDDPEDRDLGIGGRVRNRSAYAGTRFNASSNLMLGFDFLRWRTDYKGQRSGHDNRVNLIFQYSF